MELLRDIISWGILLATAAVIGLAVNQILQKVQTTFGQASTIPPVTGAAAGIATTVTLLDRGALPFLVNLVVAIIVGVVVGKVASLLVNNRSAVSLGLAAFSAVLLAVASTAAWAPTKLAQFAAIAVATLATFAFLGSSDTPQQIRRWLPPAGGVLAGIGAVDWLQAFDRVGRALASPEMDKIADTLWAVALAVGGSAAVFVAANMLFDRSGKNWSQFSTAAGAAIGFVLFGVLDGNRLLQILGPRESVATNLHSWINTNETTMMVAGVVAGAGLGLATGQGLGAMRDDRKRGRTMGAGIGAGIGLVWGALFLERIPVDTSIRVMWTATIGALLCGALGFAISKFPDDRVRAIVATVGGAAIGLVIGGLLKNIHQPRLETLPLVAAPLIGAAAGAGLGLVRRRTPVVGATTGALIGWLLATFGLPTLGGGPEVETLTATGIAGALAGLRYGAKPWLDAVGRSDLERRARGPIFLAPALAFIGAGLIIPLLRTIYLSVFDERSETFVGLENYQSIFTDPKSFDYTNRLNMFGSVLTGTAIVLVVLALGIGLYLGRTTGNSFGGGKAIRTGIGSTLILLAILEYVLGQQSDGASGGNWLAIIGLAIAGLVTLIVPIGTRIGEAAPQARVDMAGTPSILAGAGLFLFAMALFSTLRGTLFNNLWWVFTVTLLATVLGLAVAVLADRANHENIAKSFVFMPLAISFVGAGIIWRFMYIARDPSKEQTGVMNSLWVELGRVSQGGTGQVVGIAILVAILGALAVLAVLFWRTGARGAFGGSVVLIAPFLWALYRFTVGGGLGGTGVEAENGVLEGTTILFLQDSQPFNNLWLMLVLIWIQTGFAMVIFSAAIKAVPAEFVEAAKMDGANDSQIFWRITLPSIAPTVGVVVTTLIVLVMKVFDIVKVMTNGNFDTQVVANEMWQRAFTELNFGLGSALAIVLFVAVVPVMTYNIRTMQREV